MTAETAEVGVARPLHWRRALAAFLLTLLVAAALGAGFALGYHQAFAATVVPGVSAGGVSLTGLDGAGVESTLNASLPSLASGRLILHSAAGDESIPFSQLGRRYDVAAMSADATAVAHSGGLLTETGEALRTLVRGQTIPVRVTYDRAALEEAVAALASRQDTPATDASASLVKGAFTVKPGVDGRAVDQPAAVAAADRALLTPGTADITIDLRSTPVAPTVTTAEAQAAAAAAERMAGAGLVLTDAADASYSQTLPPATVRAWIAFAATPDGGYQPTVSTQKATAYLKKLSSKVSHPAVDAKYLTGSGSVVGVLAGKNGTELDVKATLAAISSTLTARIAGSPSSGPTVALAVATVEPKLTTAEAKKTAPLMKLVGSWTTHFFPSEANYWGKNISIPTSLIDGYVVQPGAWFSFWDVVGDPTLEQGYGLGGAIINGHTEETGALAGGICSCSTTLFNAALRAGYEIGQRANHYYYITRYPVGLDATVAKGPGWEQNMSFRNDTAYPVLIHGINAPGVVTFQLFSVDPHRSVTLTDPIIKNYAYASDHTQYVTTIPVGTQKRVEYPANGFDSWVTRIVRDASGKIIHEETYYSHYAVVQGLLQIGVKAPPTPPKPSPSPSPSPPPSPSPSN